jgi:hypothetical protein
MINSYALFSPSRPHSRASAPLKRLTKKSLATEAPSPPGTVRQSGSQHSFLFQFSPQPQERRIMGKLRLRVERVVSMVICQ